MRGEKPVGPKLIRGRGLARRHRNSAAPAILVYALLGAAGAIVLFKYVVVPFLTG